VTLLEHAEKYVYEIKTLKEHWVTANPKATDLLTTIQVYRNDELVGQAANHPDPGMMITCANFMAYGMAADALVISFEIYNSPLKKNPYTDEPWEAGEVAFMAREYPETVAKGWVSEAVACMGYDRAGEHFFGHLNYQLEDGKVVWGDQAIFKSDDEDAMSFDSGVHEALTDIMARETILDRMRADLGEDTYNTLRGVFSEERRYWQQDQATIKHVLSSGLACTAGLVAKPDTERYFLIETGMHDILAHLGDKFDTERGGAPTIDI